MTLKELKAKTSLGFLVFRAVDILLDGAQNEQPMLQDPAGTVQVQKDIPYTANPEWSKYCAFDIFRIPSEQKQPVLFNIHGGGFDAGGKKYRRGMSTWLAKTGICVINVEYGLSPYFNFKESLQQLAAGMNWVVDHAEEYNFNLDRVMVGGDSSGGYMGLGCINLTNNAEYRKVIGVDEVKLQFAGSYLNCGIYDLHKMLHTPVIGLVAGVLSKDTMGAWKRQFDTHPDAYHCSPINYVTKDFPKEAFFTYAKYDALCFGQTQNLLKKLDAYGCPYEEYHSTNPLMNHCFMFNWMETGQCAENNQKVYTFVENFVKKSY